MQLQGQMNVPGMLGQASKVSDGRAFLQGQAGCTRSQAGDRGMISKRESESRSQSPGQLHTQQTLHARLHSWQRERGQSSCRASRGWARSLASNDRLLPAWGQSCLCLCLWVQLAPRGFSPTLRATLLPSALPPSCPFSPHTTTRPKALRKAEVGRTASLTGLPHWGSPEKDKAQTDTRQPLTLKWKRYILRHPDLAALARVSQRHLWADHTNTAAPNSGGQFFTAWEVIGRRNLIILAVEQPSVCQELG